MTQEKTSIPMISLISYIIYDMYSDFTSFQDIYYKGFINHFDTRTSGFLFGKFSNFTLKFVMAYLLNSSFEVNMIP